jgi:excisionase family DNA binding protein
MAIRPRCRASCYTPWLPQRLERETDCSTADHEACPTVASKDLAPALEELIDEIVDRVAERVLEQIRAEVEAPPTSPYLTVPEASELLRCRRQRVDDLLSQRRLTRYKEGRRTLVSRAEIEVYVEGSG